MRRGETGHVTVQLPDSDPQGLGAAGIFREYYDLSTTIDQPTLDKITRRVLLHARRQQWSEQDRRDYKKLTDDLSMLGFNREFSDPYFAQFAAAMARRHEATLRKLTPKEKAELDDYADTVLIELERDDK